MTLGRRVIEFLAQAVCQSGFPWFARPRWRGRLAILMYHGVERETPAMPCWHILHENTFRRQMRYLRRYFNVLPLEEALERLEAGTLPDRAVALTFDDGTRNLATCVAPILGDLDLPAAVFLTTGPMERGGLLWADALWTAFALTSVPEVDLAVVGLPVTSLRRATDRADAYQAVAMRLKERPDAERIRSVDLLITRMGVDPTLANGPFQMLSWQEARKLSGYTGVTLHPHTVTHPILSRCPEDKINHEIDESCATVERETGIPATVFAYPNGRRHDFDDRAKAALRRRGVRWALASEVGFADRHSDPLALPRIPIGGDLPFARFCFLVFGALSLSSRGRRRSLKREDRVITDVSPDRLGELSA